MAKARDRFGIIILGNSGVGKSFLANILLGRDAFTHKSTATAVTTKTESHEVTFDGVKYAIFNIPGLIESNQDKIDTNKQEIDKAFSECPNAVVIYVFGNQKGRIRNEDVIAFNALNDAYPFHDKSLVLVLNCKPPPKPNDEDYEGATILHLRELLKLKEWETMCFLDDITNEDQKAGKQKLREQLLPSILASMPKVHVKQHDIRLQLDELNDLMQKYKALEENFKKEKTKSEEAVRRATGQAHSAQEKYKREKKRRREDVDKLKQKEQEPTATNARQTGQRPGASAVAENPSAWNRGVATATAAGVAAAPFGPLVAALSAASGFVAGYLASDE